MPAEYHPGEELFQMIRDVRQTIAEVKKAGKEMGDIIIETPEIRRRLGIEEEGDQAPQNDNEPMRYEVETYRTAKEVTVVRRSWLVRLWRSLGHAFGRKST